MSLSEIVKIVRVDDVEGANELLSKGWVLLTAGCLEDKSKGLVIHSYSLGQPAIVKVTERIEKGEFPSD